MSTDFTLDLEEARAANAAASERESEHRALLDSLTFRKDACVTVQMKRAMMGLRPGDRLRLTTSEAATAIGAGAAVADDPRLQHDFLLAGEQGREAARSRRSFGEFLVLVANQNESMLKTLYGVGREAPASSKDLAGLGSLPLSVKAALAESSGAGGGFTVPPQFNAQILDAGERIEPSVFRPRCQVLPMDAATLQVPVPDWTTSPGAAGASPFLAQLSLPWTAEARTRTVSQVQFRQLELKAWEASATFDVSNALVQDGAGGALDAYLTGLAGRAAAWTLDFACFQGNGVGQPLGVLSAGCTLKVNRNSAGNIRYIDLSSMLSKLLPGSLSRALWACSPTALPQLLQLADGAGRAIFLEAAARREGDRPVFALAGLPLIVTEKLPALGTLGDLVLIDPWFQLMGLRSLLVAASPHVQFTKNQTTFRITLRGDAQPVLDKAVTLQDTSTQVSSFVALN
jgi:HK97 family phage major capsid protein